MFFLSLVYFLTLPTALCLLESQSTRPTISIYIRFFQIHYWLVVVVDVAVLDHLVALYLLVIFMICSILILYMLVFLYMLWTFEIRMVIDRRGWKTLLIWFLKVRRGLLRVGRVVWVRDLNSIIASGGFSNVTFLFYLIDYRTFISYF